MGYVETKQGADKKYYIISHNGNGRLGGGRSGEVVIVIEVNAPIAQAH